MHYASIIQAAKLFWEKVGFLEPFPRSLEKPVAWSLPLTIVKIPRLSLHRAIKWLKNRDIPIELQKPERQLCALLIAKYGHGIIFIDAVDSDDQIRFSMAHEVAHFLLDYLEPREIAINKLGGQIQEVLDGLRPPTSQERLAGILRGVELSWYSHFLDRDLTGNVSYQKILNSEDRADILAIELLAPREQVLLALKKEGVDYTNPEEAKRVNSLLTIAFGLPSFVATHYSQILTIRRKKRQTFQQWLKG